MDICILLSLNLFSQLSLSFRVSANHFRHFILILCSPDCFCLSVCSSICLSSNLSVFLFDCLFLMFYLPSFYFQAISSFSSGLPIVLRLPSASAHIVVSFCHLSFIHDFLFSLYQMTTQIPSPYISLHQKCYF